MYDGTRLDRRLSGKRECPQGEATRGVLNIRGVVSDIYLLNSSSWFMGMLAGGSPELLLWNWRLL